MALLVLAYYAGSGEVSAVDCLAPSVVPLRETLLRISGEEDLLDGRGAVAVGRRADDKDR